jgi:hypothetical protein
MRLEGRECKEWIREGQHVERLVSKGTLVSLDPQEVHLQRLSVYVSHQQQQTY